jgi:hypothetical protein
MSGCCSLFLEVHADLAKAAKQGKGAAVKVAAAEALALCCFVAAEDEHTTLEVMEQLHGLWGKGGHAFLTASASFVQAYRQSPRSAAPGTLAVHAHTCMLIGGAEQY